MNGRSIYDVTLVGTLRREDTSEREVKQYLPHLEGELANYGLTIVERYDERFEPADPEDESDWGRKLDPTFHCTFAVEGAAYAHNQRRAFRSIRERFHQAAEDALCELGEVEWAR